MGNNISTVGDLFFPDNPNRRCRAQELQQQILTFGEEFKELQATRYHCPYIHVISFMPKKTYADNKV